MTNPDSMRNDPSEIRTLIVSAMGLAISVWDIAFNLGVHGTIFYSKLQMLWVASTVVLLCVLMADDDVHKVSGFGVFALLTPTIWFVLNALTPTVNVTWFDELMWIIALGIFVIAIPYILYIIFDLVDNDFFSLSAYHRKRLIFMVIFVAIVGYFVGVNHQYFVSCEQFRAAGDEPPSNCLSWER